MSHRQAGASTDAHPRPPLDPATAGARAPRPAGWSLAVLVVLVVLTQRLALPLPGGTQLPVTAPLLLLGALLGWVRGTLQVDLTSTRFFGVACVTLALVTVVTLLAGDAPSLTSLVLLVALYLPAVLVPRDPALVDRALRVFLDLMIVASVVGVGLFLGQYTGLPYRDYVTDLVPPAFVLEGYNTAGQLAYDSAVRRANAVVFLEASFFSIFVALAVLVGLWLRRRTAWLSVLLLALVCTGSGNGILVLAAGIPVLLLRGRAGWCLRAMAVPALLAVVALVATPVGQLIVERTDEIGATNSSAYSRFVEPYTVVLPTMAGASRTSLLGHGAGAVDDLYRSLGRENPAFPAPFVPVVPKLLYEYGWLGAAVTMAFLVRVVGAGVSRVPWSAGVALAYFVVNASLLQSTMVAIALLFVTWCAGVSRRGQRVSRSGQEDVRPPSAEVTRGSGPLATD